MVLGYAIGPLVWGPLSETIGRRYVFLWSYVFYVLWTCLCAAAQNIQTLIVFRFLAGTFGSSALCIPGGQIADMFSNERRALGILIFCVAPFSGPTMVRTSLLAGFC
jgi:MFS family permease